MPEAAGWPAPPGSRTTIGTVATHRPWCWRRRAAPRALPPRRRCCVPAVN